MGYAEQTVPGGQAGASRSATAVGVRGRIGWQPARTANLSYRRTLSPALSLVLNVNDLFGAHKTEMVTETARLRERSVRRGDGRVGFMGLSHRFGSFGGGNPGPGGPGMRPMGPPGR